MFYFIRIYLDITLSGHRIAHGFIFNFPVSLYNSHL